MDASPKIPFRPTQVEKTTTLKICPQCTAQLQIRDRTCPQCGARFAISMKGYCPTCKTTVQVSNSRWCSRCGGEVSNPMYESKYIEIVAPTARKIVAPAPSVDVHNLQAQAKIHCQKCKAQNNPGEARCQQCGAKLLPAENIGTRFGFFLGGIFAGALFAALTYFKVQYPDSILEICPSPLYLAGGAIFIPLIGIGMALRRTPAHVRYEQRAKRHSNLNAWQAIADFSKALELSPEKERAAYLKQRALLYEKLGMQKDSLRDLLTLTSEPGALRDQAWFVKMLGADADVYVSSRIDSTRHNFLASGKAKAVGYCRKCKQIVELNTDLHCLQHTKQKGERIRLVLPDEVEQGKRAIIREQQQEKFQKRKGKILYAIAFVGLAIATYILLYK